MKKFFLFALAAAFAFTSCTKDETLATAQPGAIDFAVAANNATRSNYDPSISTNGENDTKAISDFAVYGHMRNSEQGTSGEVFREEVVTGSNANGWSYNNTQYWTKNIYYFAALAPYEGRKWTATAISGDYGIGQVQFPNDGTQDLRLMKELISKLPDVPVFVRTTILPGTSDILTRETGHEVCYMPEFLTERTHIEDFKKQTMVFTGAVELLTKIFVGKKFAVMTPLEAELAKYMHNVFGAYKVTYFNACREYCEKMGADWRTVHTGCLLSGTSTTCIHMCLVLMVSLVMVVNASPRMLMHLQR